YYNNRHGITQIAPPSAPENIVIPDGYSPVISEQIVIAPIESPTIIQHTENSILSEMLNKIITLIDALADKITEAISQQ
nr:hypothetical protein [Clostridia bacterium]